MPFIICLNRVFGMTQGLMKGQQSHCLCSVPPLTLNAGWLAELCSSGSEALQENNPYAGSCGIWHLIRVVCLFCWSVGAVSRLNKGQGCGLELREQRNGREYLRAKWASSAASGPSHRQSTARAVFSAINRDGLCDGRAPGASHFAS